MNWQQACELPYYTTAATWVPTPTAAGTTFKLWAPTAGGRRGRRCLPPAPTPSRARTSWAHIELQRERWTACGAIVAARRPGTGRTTSTACYFHDGRAA